MTLIVTDPQQAERMIAERRARGIDQFDEVWEGVYVMSPIADNQHQDIQLRLASMLLQSLGNAPDTRVQAATNVSDRDDDWEHNYRVPDVAVFLPGTTARDCGSHWFGGPDFAVEILSPGDRTPQKLPFYASVNVHELLVIARKPWSLRLYRLRDRELVAAAAVLPNGDALVSDVLNLSFRLIEGSPRPTIQISRRDGSETWSV